MAIPPEAPDVQVLLPFTEETTGKLLVCAKRRKT
jgi:hypothetical protein